MSKEEIIKNIKDGTELYMFNREIYTYTKGYLDALCQVYEITWEERIEIEEELKNGD